MFKITVQLSELRKVEGQVKTFRMKALKFSVNNFWIAFFDCLLERFPFFFFFSFFVKKCKHAKY